MEQAGFAPDGVSYALLLEVMLEGENTSGCVEVLGYVTGPGNSPDGADGLPGSAMWLLRDPSMQQAMRRLCVALARGNGDVVAGEDGPRVPDWPQAATVARLLVATTTCPVAPTGTPLAEEGSGDGLDAVFTSPALPRYLRTRLRRLWALQQHQQQPSA